MGGGCTEAQRRTSSAQRVCRVPQTKVRHNTVLKNCKKCLIFFLYRAAIEEQLGKSLVKLAKSVSIREDQDPQSNVWEMMKSQTETSGLAHLKSAHQLSAELTKISEISEQSRDKRRLKEESVR